MKYFAFILLFWGLTSCNDEKIKELKFRLTILQSRMDKSQDDLKNCKYELEEARQTINVLENHAVNLGNELTNFKSVIDDFDWRNHKVQEMDWEYSNVRNSFNELMYEFHGF